jgi:hypothetical protein
MRKEKGEAGWASARKRNRVNTKFAPRRRGAENIRPLRRKLTLIHIASMPDLTDVHYV